MIVTIHQPDFLPWLGFFDRWKKSNLYIVLDDVQFLRQGWHHRDRIMTTKGPSWLTVPVYKKNKYTQLIRDVKIDNKTSWRKSHLRTIEVNYKKAPGFDNYFSKIEDIYAKNHPSLIDLNMDLLKLIADEFKIEIPLRMASEYKIKSDSTQRLVDLVKAAGGTKYLTGVGSRDYLDESLFHKEGIEVIWQEYEHPVYKQLHGEFVSGLSAVDYLMMSDKGY